MNENNTTINFIVHKINTKTNLVITLCGNSAKKEN